MCSHVYCVVYWLPLSLYYTDKFWNGQNSNPFQANALSSSRLQLVIIHECIWIKNILIVDHKSYLASKAFIGQALVVAPVIAMTRRYQRRPRTPLRPCWASHMHARSVARGARRGVNKSDKFTFTSSTTTSDLFASLYNCYLNEKLKFFT